MVKIVPLRDQNIKSESKASSERAVVQLVEALRYKPEGGRFDSRLCHWNFSLT
jgi:hypothetical protein